MSKKLEKRIKNCKQKMNRNKIKMNKNLLIVLAFLLFNIGYSQQLKTWTGAVSTAWDTDSNWSPIGKPTSTENVLITNSANQPVISITGAACATLTLSNSTPSTTVVLTVKTSTTGTFSPTSIIMNSSGGSTSVCSLNINTGRVVTGNVTMNPLQNNVTFSDDGTLFVGGIMTGGTLNAHDKGTVNYSGSGTRDVGTYSYNDLTISGSGTRTISSGVIVNGTLTMGGSAKVSAAPTYGPAASLLYNSMSALTVGPEWVSPFIATGGIEISNPTLNPGSSVVTINDGLEKILGEGVPLVIDEEATLVTNGDIYITGDLMNNRGALKTDGYVYLAGNKNQSIDSFTAAKGVVMNKTGGVATFTEDIMSKELIINGSGTLNLGIARTHTFTSWTRTQGTLDGGSSTLKFSGNVIGNGGDFVPGTSTVEFNGGVQNLGSGSITYNNLTLSGSGTKTFGAKTTINETISIISGVIADLTANLVHSAKNIKLGTGLMSGGSWGSSLSNAVNKNNTYFVSNNGIINVGATIVISTNNLPAMTTIYGTSSASNSFDMSGIAMLEGILVTPSSEFEVSTDGINFSDKITLGGVGAIALSKVYVRLKAKTPAGSYSLGNVALSSNGTTTINIPIATSTVDKAELTIKVDNKEKFYGSLNPDLTVSYSGFVNGEDKDILTKLPTITTTALKESTVGTYLITASGAETLNYKFKYEPVNGSLVVKKATLTVTTIDDSREYGSDNPVLKVVYSGFVNGDSEESGAFTKPVITTTALKDSPVVMGGYKISADNAFSPNYTFDYKNIGILTINTAKLTIAAISTQKTHGDNNPSLTVKYDGFKNGDTALQLDSQVTIDTDAKIDSGIGEYLITVSGATSKNYMIEFIDGTLKVVASSNAGLSDIIVIDSSLDKPFDTDNKDYKVEVPNETNTYVVNPVPSNPNATVVITVDGKVIDPANPIDLKVGDNEIKIVVTAEDGITQEEYIVIVKRDPSNNSGLIDLAISEGKLEPGFTEGNTEYTATVPNSTSTINVTPITSDSTATVTVNGVEVPSGTASAELPLEVGENTITTIVKAEDGTTTTYTVIVTREEAPLSHNSGLIDLAISEGKLEPGFTEGNIEYTAIVPNGTSTINVTPITSDSTATVTVNGVEVPSGTASANLPLEVGENEIKTIVTTQDGTTTTYIVVVTREEAPLSHNSGLIDLAISEGKLEPGFTEGNIEYTAIVPNGTSTINVTPITSDSTATVTVNGVEVPSGTASANLPLEVGENEIKTVVTAQDGTTTTYIVVVTREEAPLSNNSGLIDLSISEGKLEPGFTEGNIEYIATVPNGTSTINVTPITSDSTATVTVNGVEVPSGTASANLPLEVGENEIKTIVTAQDGTTTTYIVVVTREEAPLSHNSSLIDLAISEGKLEPGFTEGNIEYTAIVPNGTSTINVTPITSDSTATVTVNGVEVPSGTASANLPLEVGENTITTIVKAEDGTTTTYTVIVTREAAVGPDNAGLSDIVINDGTLKPDFNTDQNDYRVDVPNETNSIVITPITIDPNSTVEMIVDGKTVNPTLPIDLNVGDNEITIIVSAPDGTKDTYVVIVDRADAEPQAIIPTNIITPNGDGKNDYWIIPGIEQYPNNSVKVFDRAARLVYSKNNYNNEWDGTYKGSPLNEDTYYYLIDLGSGQPKIKGFITIVRD
jgi:gliding motility-associated-like protein